jgi:hypothetical protein
MPDNRNQRGSPDDQSGPPLCVDRRGTVASNEPHNLLLALSAARRFHENLSFTFAALR